VAPIPRASPGTDLLPYLFPETPKARPFSRNSTRGAAATKNPKTGVLQPCPGTLPEGEIVIGGLFITMPASGEMRE